MSQMSAEGPQIKTQWTLSTIDKCQCLQWTKATVE